MQSPEGLEDTPLKKNEGSKFDNNFNTSNMTIDFFAVYYLTSSGFFKTFAWKILSLVCISLVCIRAELEPKLITALVEVQRVIYDIQT